MRKIAIYTRHLHFGIVNFKQKKNQMRKNILALENKHKAKITWALFRSSFNSSKYRWIQQPRVLIIRYDHDKQSQFPILSDSERQNKWKATLA